MLGRVRQMITWKRVKTSIYIVILLSVVVVIQLVINRSYQDESKLVRAFEETKVTPVKGKLQVVGNFGEKYLTTADKESLIDYVSSKLGITDTLEKKEQKGDTTISIAARTAGSVSETAIEAISITSEDKEKVKETTQYLYVTIDIFQGISSVLGYKEIIEEAFTEVGLEDIDTSIVLTGRYKGQLNLIEKDKVTDQILEQLQADVVAENRTEALYTVYGYTHTIADSLKIDGKNVNVNVAFSYDEEKDETTLYLASPVMNEDY